MTYTKYFAYTPKSMQNYVSRLTHILDSSCKLATFTSKINMFRYLFSKKKMMGFEKYKC